MDEADLFVLGLERRYDLGMRAEGVTVAENLIRNGKRVLVVGSETSARQVMSPIYWDIGSEGTFLQAVGRCLSGRQPNPGDIAPLTAFFEERIRLDIESPAKPIQGELEVLGDLLAEIAIAEGLIADVEGELSGSFVLFGIAEHAYPVSSGGQHVGQIFAQQPLALFTA